MKRQRELKENVQPLESETLGVDGIGSGAGRLFEFERGVVRRKRSLRQLGPFPRKRWKRQVAFPLNPVPFSEDVDTIGARPANLTFMSPTSPHEPGAEDVARWIQEARGGDPEALDALLRHTGPRLEEEASARLGPGLRRKVGSSDVLQSTYLKVVSSLPSFEGATEADFTAWATRILENTIRNRARHFRARKRDARKETSRDVGEVNPAGHERTPSSEAMLGERLLRIGQAIKSLSPEHVKILTLHMDPEQTHRETARLLGKSEGATRVMLARARAALLVALDRED